VQEKEFWLETSESWGCPDHKRQGSRAVAQRDCGASTVDLLKTQWDPGLDSLT